MNRNQRIENAQQTLAIIQKGVFVANGHEVNIADAVSRSVEDTVLYTPDVLSEISKEVRASENYKTTISVVNQTTMEALCEMKNGRTGCLNFASARNPGGGFLTGALAQEESLAAASSLYLSQLKCMAMYEYNRSRKTSLYSDYMIYSPDVVFIKDDNGCLLANPYRADVLTSPAVNVSAIKQNNPSELALVEQTMLTRIDKLLAVFVKHEVQNLVLGAWGCGVFQNNPHDVARYFARYLTGNGKYASHFTQIVFAIYDRSRSQEIINPFCEIF